MGKRFSNISIMDIKTNGITAAGANGVMLFNGCLANVNGGSFMDLGTSTFNSLSYLSCFATLAAGTFFLSGAAASANITAGKHENRLCESNIKASRQYSSSTSQLLQDREEYR